MKQPRNYEAQNSAGGRGYTSVSPLSSKSSPRKIKRSLRRKRRDLDREFRNWKSEHVWTVASEDTRRRIDVLQDNYARCCARIEEMGDQLDTDGSGSSRSPSPRGKTGMMEVPYDSEGYGDSNAKLYVDAETGGTQWNHDSRKGSKASTMEDLQAKAEGFEKAFFC